MGSVTVYNALKREVDRNRQFYETMSRRADEAAWLQRSASPTSAWSVLPSRRTIPINRMSRSTSHL